MADKINETTIYYTHSGVKANLTLIDGDLIPADVKLVKAYARGSDGEVYYRIVLMGGD